MARQWCSAISPVPEYRRSHHVNLALIVRQYDNFQPGIQQRIPEISIDFFATAAFAQSVPAKEQFRQRSSP
jgi:hypothetical protein